jgi:glyoxylase-like metal-dependent hydrolase (beta-lactamase superfamily II)
MPSELALPDSKHFTVQPLAEGVFAVIAKDGGSAICNAGIIDLGNMCLVFDTFLTPSAAEDLRQSVKHLVGNDPDIVINSHYHNDHIWGNQAFPSTVHIIASSRTYQLMMTAGKKELEEETATAGQSLAHFKDQYQKAETEDQRRTADLFLGYYEGLVHDLPHLAVRFPDILYEGRLSFHGSKRSAELIPYDNCHTGNDAVLFLPDDGIIFMGDLLFVGCHPYLGDGDPANLVKTLKKIQHFKATRFVPGHGSLGTTADLDLLVEYIEGCQKAAQVLVKEGRADKEIIKAMEVPGKFKHWYLAMFYQSNLRSLCSHLVSEE